MNKIRDLLMIRAINARSDDSHFLDDVAQWEGKNLRTLGLVKIG
jgi:hypothetical protein